MLLVRLVEKGGLEERPLELGDGVLSMLGDSLLFLENKPMSAGGGYPLSAIAVSRFGGRLRGSRVAD